MSSPSQNWRERGFNKPGRKPDYARQAIKAHFRLTDRQARVLNPLQIQNCKDNAARRLLMGISR